VWEPSLVLSGLELRSLPRKVVNQAERILDVASWKIRLIFDDFTTALYEPELGFFDAVDRHFQNRPQSWTSLDE